MLTDLKKNITREEMDQLPPFLFKGEITVVEDPEAVAGAADRLACHSMLGFDTETRPSFNKGEKHQVSLLQLASEEEACLFRLNKCGFVPALRRLLENPDITKIGVAIRDDIRHLQQIAGFTPAAFIEMQTYAEQFGIQDKSFSKLMAIVFGVKISKRQRISNWEAPVLTEAQIRYAATDAWGALEMYRRLSGLL